MSPLASQAASAASHAGFGGRLLQRALELAEEIEDGATAYLIERALDEVRSETFSSVPADAGAKH
jgi:hypothetical protein